MLNKGGITDSVPIYQDIQLYIEEEKYTKSIIYQWYKYFSNI